MRKIKFSSLFILLILSLLLNGCGENQRVRGSMQINRISELESQLQAANLKLGQAARQRHDITRRAGIGNDALKQEVAAMGKSLEDKKSLIKRMQQQLLYGGSELPVELSTMLEDFAKGESKMISYDSNRGVIKFVSDLVFKSGSDVVIPVAKANIEKLCKILNTVQGQKFDMIIAGHTDDVRIGKPETRRKHPTNWHLSAHRAIAVLNVMRKANIDPVRTSIRGFGEYRPIAPNKPGKQGNPQNRRVEIYIVAKGL